MKFKYRINYKYLFSVNRYELGFIVFFIPLFVLKLMNITAENKLLAATGAICFISWIFISAKNKYEVKTFYLLASLAIFSGLLIFTCGKQGAFFSIIMLAALNKVNIRDKILTMCFAVGVIVLIICCIKALSWSGRQVQVLPFIESLKIPKRGNIYYISFMAVACLYLLIHSSELRKKHITYILLASIAMYLYLASRSGIIVMMLLCGCLWYLRDTRRLQNRFIRFSILCLPTFCFISLFATSLIYWEYEYLHNFNSLLSGRLVQNRYFIVEYPIKLFGQHIWETTNLDEYRILDSAYMDMLLCEGLIFSLIWISGNYLVTNYFIRKGRYVEVSILTAYAVYGITETFLPNCFLNMSWFIYGEWLYRKATYNTHNLCLPLSQGHH